MGNLRVWSTSLQWTPVSPVLCVPTETEYKRSLLYWCTGKLCVECISKLVKNANAVPTPIHIT